MATEKEIKANYKNQHDELSASYYGGNSGLTKEQFEQQHGQIWADMDAELIAEGLKAQPITRQDVKVQYAAASDTEKLSILASQLGLED